MLSAWMENTKGAEIYLIFLVGILLIPAWFPVRLGLMLCRGFQKVNNHNNHEPCGNKQNAGEEDQVDLCVFSVLHPRTEHSFSPDQ